MDFGFQNEGVWELKSTPKMRSVARRPNVKKNLENPRFFFNILMVCEDRIFNEKWIKIWTNSGSVSDPPKNHVFIDFMLKKLPFWGTHFQQKSI